MPGLSFCNPTRHKVRCRWLLHAAQRAHEAALDGRLDEVRLQCMMVQLLLARLDRSPNWQSGQDHQALLEVHRRILAVEATLAAQRLEVLSRLEGIACAAEYHDALQPKGWRTTQPGFLV